MSLLGGRIGGHSVFASILRFSIRPFSRKATRLPASTPPAPNLSLKTTGMQWTASVLSTVSADSEPSLMINFDNAKYMINVGENAVRALCHSHTNRKRVQAVIVTRLTLERAGGLNGMLMTLSDANQVENLTVVGPQGLLHRLACSRTYTFRKNLCLNPIEVWNSDVEATQSSSSLRTPMPVFQDKNISLYAYPLFPSLQTHHDDIAVDAAGTLKRKRDSSPDTPRKKSNPEFTTPLPSSHSRDEPSLAALMKDPVFKPETLTGALADEWRRIVVRRMFPAVQPKSKESPDIPNDASGNVDDYKRGMRIPRGWHDALPPPHPSVSMKSAIAYVLVGPLVRGKFDVKKSDALGVPRGPLRGKLSKGEAVTFNVEETVAGEDGKERKVSRSVTVKPEDCVEPPFPRSAVLVLDVPSPEYLPTLFETFREDTDSLVTKLRSSKPEDRSEIHLKTVFHILGDGVLEDPRYAEFMNEVGGDAHHVVASREYCPNPVTFTSAAANQVRLNKLDDSMFPLPQFQITPRRNISDIPNLPPNTRLMSSNLTVPVHPSGAPTKLPNAVIKDLFHPMLENRHKDGSIFVPQSKETRAKFAQAKKVVGEAKCTIDHSTKKPGDDVVVVPLGTGSAIPAQYRTVSSTLIQIPNWGNIFLDAGEGTYFQVARHFGEEEADHVLRNTKLIFVSHSHADHLMGVAMLLRKRLNLTPPPEHPLYLVTIRSVQQAFLEYQQLDDLGIKCISHSDPVPDQGNAVIPILSEALHYRRPGVYSDQGFWSVHGDAPWIDINRNVANTAKLQETLGLSRLSTVDMVHGTRAYGLVMDHHDGWSIAFSGDTEPTENLVSAARGATLLIHEATMGDDQVKMARAKKHSTFGEAIEIGKRMNAEKILLTHFSARHPKLPMRLLSPSPPGSPRRQSRSRTPDRQSSAPPAPVHTPLIGLALDQSSFRIGDMWKMRHYLRALEQNYKDVADVDGEGEEEELERLRMSG